MSSLAPKARRVETWPTPVADDGDADGDDAAASASSAVPEEHTLSKHEATRRNLEIYEDLPKA